MRKRERHFFGRLFLLVFGYAFSRKERLLLSVQSKDTKQTSDVIKVVIYKHNKDEFSYYKVMYLWRRINDKKSEGNVMQVTNSL